VDLLARDSKPLAASATLSPSSFRHFSTERPGCTEFFFSMVLSPFGGAPPPIHVESVSILKSKDNASIRADSHHKKPFQLTFEGMRVESRRLHDFNRLRGV
jgi:hypothetical protein